MIDSISDVCDIVRVDQRTLDVRGHLERAGHAVEIGAAAQGKRSRSWQLLPNISQPNCFIRRMKSAGGWHGNFTTALDNCSRRSR